MKKLIVILLVAIVSTFMIMTINGRGIMQHYTHRDSVSFETDTIQLLSNDSLVSFHVTYPKVCSGDPMAEPLNLSIEMLLVNLLFGNYEEGKPFKEQLLREFNEMHNDRVSVKSVAQWEITADVSFVYNENGVLTTLFSTYQYLGGAHGMASDVYISRTIGKTMENIPLSALFSENGRKHLTDVAEQIFRSENGIADSVSLDDAGYMFGDNGFTLTENYAITADGVQFHYNPYDIAPYAMGPSTFIVPYNRFRKYLITGTERFWGQ